MHFVNNAIGVSALYAVRNNPKKIDQVMDSNLMYYWVIVGLIALFILFKQLKKVSATTESIASSE
jgi:hypothetical protein